MTTMTDNNEDKQWTNFDQEYHLPLNDKKKMDLHENMTPCRSSCPLWIQLGYIIITITIFLSHWQHFLCVAHVTRYGRNCICYHVPHTEREQLLEPVMLLTVQVTLQLRSPAFYGAFDIQIHVVILVLLNQQDKPDGLHYNNVPNQRATCTINIFERQT